MELRTINFTEKSNFEAHSNMYKDKEPIMRYENMCEPIDWGGFETKNIRFKKTLCGKFYLDYPLRTLVEVKYTAQDLHSLIKEIRKAYKVIYMNFEKNGI